MAQKSQKSGSTGSDSPEKLRQRLLAAILPHVPFDGWSDAALARARDDAGLDQSAVAAALPRGLLDLVLAFAAWADAQMLEKLAQTDPNNLKIRERITLAVRTRLDVLAPHREAERRALNYMSLPHRAPEAAKALARTVDAMWRWAGDTATDFNYYSKRGILAGVYSATLLYWLADESEDFAGTWDFLGRRIADVMQIEKLKADVKKRLDDLPDLFGRLGRARHGGKSAA